MVSILGTALLLLAAGGAGAFLSIFTTKDTSLPTLRSYITDDERKRREDEAAEEDEEADGIETRLAKQEDAWIGKPIPAENLTLFRDMRARADAHREKAAAIRRELDGNAMWVRSRSTWAYVLAGSLFGLLLGALVTVPIPSPVEGLDVSRLVAAMVAGASWPQFWAAVKGRAQNVQLAEDNLKLAEEAVAAAANAEAALKGVQTGMLSAPTVAGAGAAADAAGVKVLGQARSLDGTIASLSGKVADLRTSVDRRTRGTRARKRI